jgi:hypothetical protein
VAALLLALATGPAGEPTALDAARSALRDGRLDEAWAGFERRLAADPLDADALVGAGFTALRQGRLEAARQLFARCVAASPRYADAHLGLALVEERQGRPDAARVHLRRALALEPGREDLRAAEARLGPGPAPLPPLVLPPALDLRFRVGRERGFELREAGGWRPVFLKGVNLGAALPGRFPSEFPSKETYRAWLAEIAEAGFGVIRVYTIHPPWFYEALRQHNLVSRRPLLLVHGVWVEPPPGDDFEDPAWSGDFEAEMGRVVDLLHGRADLAERPGHAAGSYRADVSHWVLAYILGREWEPQVVEAFDARHPGAGDFLGRFVRCRGGLATERFMARAMERLLAYEHDGYRTQRPVAFTSWPTLDPLHHPTESTRAEEARLRRFRLEPGEIVKEYDNDAVALDMEKFEAGPELQAGLFASYHAYPYYPDFMSLDPGYQAGRDHLGENGYAAYLRDLVRHHRRHAVVIAETGVPASRLVAHWQPQGLTHGGQDERQQGEQDARLLRDVRDAGCAGAVLFAWIDEWFKRSWLVTELEEPPERKPLWYNVEDAEENYGLVGYRPGAGGPTVVVDGKDGDWQGVPAYLEGEGLALRLRADEGWLHLLVTWREGAFDPARDTLLLGIDTHDVRAGSHRLPPPLPLRSEAGLEFVVRVQDGRAALLVDEPYDLFTHRFRRPYRSRQNDDGRFVMPRTESNRRRVGRDGTEFPARRQEIGWLRRGTQDRADPAFDSLAEWQLGPGVLEVSLPWGLLNVTDPSSRRVARDGPAQRSGPVGTVVTDGFRVVLAAGAAAPQAGRVVATDPGRPARTLPARRGGRIALPPLFTWPTWEQPAFHRFRKLSFGLVQAALRELPDEPRMTP